jgi:NAD-dependent dihydropyrimidine dehydrogenase PreA subunit
MLAIIGWIVLALFIGIFIGASCRNDIKFLYARILTKTRPDLCKLELIDWGVGEMRFADIEKCNGCGSCKEK